MKYRQLTQPQRYTIFTMWQKKSTLQAIADELNRIEEEAAIADGIEPPTHKISPSTISRELRRNRTKQGHYNPKLANEMAKEKRERVVHNSALKPGVLKRAIDLLKQKSWSPEQISGYLKKQGICISK